MASSRRRSTSRVRIWAALALVGAWSSLEAGDAIERKQLVEVRADGRVLAERALLVESLDQGFLLRLGDLKEPLPEGLDRLARVRRNGEPFLALDPARLDLRLEPGALVLVGLAEPVPADRTAPPAPEPSAAPPAAEPSLQGADASLKPLDGGPVVEVIWLGEGPPPKILPFVEAPKTAKVVLAKPGPVRRRDPVEPPLLERDAWREWLLSVVLNGELVSGGALFIRNPDGQWAVQVLDLRAWRVRLDNDRIITFNGEAFYPLAALPDLQSRYDAAALTIEMDLPPEQFEPTALQARRPTTLAAVAGRGGFFDYDLLFVTGDDLRTRLDALLELGLFDPMGVLISDVRAGDVANDERAFVRLDTTFTKDFPERRATLRLGDSLTEGGALGRPVRFGGVQWSTDFSTDPTFVTFPLPTIGGLADQPSVAEVFLDNARRVTEQVPAGPFAIENLPALTGAGEIQLKVTDLLGREELVTQSYYVSSRLLRAGLSDYSYELGFERDKFNEASFDYGKPLAAATHRYGFTDGVTGEARLEVAQRQQTLGAGGSTLLGTFGLLSGGLVGSRHDGEPGFQAFADYEYRANRFDVGLRTRYSSAGFRQLGLDQEPARRIDQASFGLNVYPFGRLGMFLVNADNRDGPSQRSVSANYSVPIGPGALLLNAVRTLDGEGDFAVTATYSVALTPIDSINSSVGYQDKDVRSRSQYSRSRGASDIGPSYRIASEAGRDARLVDASLRYDASLASGQVDASYQEGRKAMRTSLDGALAYVDGHAGLTRQLGRAFGIVDLPGYPDVTVFVENREVGQTNDAGYLFLPRLNPYQENRVRIQAEDLPLNAQIDVEEKVAVPYDRSGVGVTFDVRDNRTALATLVDQKGDPLPAGLELTGADGKVTAQVADRGFAYITSVGGDAVDLQSVQGQPAFRCALPALPEEPMAELGEIRCD